jgi:hypothetical protein
VVEGSVSEKRGEHVMKRLHRLAITVAVALMLTPGMGASRG